MRLRRRAWLIFVALSVALGVLSASIPGVTELEGPLSDLLFLLRGRAPTEDTEVVVVGVDRDAITRLGGWPWSAEAARQALAAVAAGRPRAIVLTFPTPEASVRVDGPPVALPVAAELSPALGAEYGRPWRTLEPMGERGGVDLLPPEATLRRLPVLLRDPHGPPTPALLGRALERITGQLLLPAPDADEVRLGDGRSLPVDRTDLGWALRVNYAGPAYSTFGVIYLKSVLNGEVGPAELAGKVVVLGPVSPDLDAGLVTPTASQLRMPKVEVYAHALDTALRHGRALRPVPVWGLGVGLALAAALLALTLRQLRPALGAAATCLVLVGYAFVALGAFRAGSLVPLLPAVISFPLLYVGLGLLRAYEVDLDLEDLVDELSRLDRRFYVADEGDEATRWRRALGLAALFVDVESMVLLRTDPETERLQFLAGYRVSEKDVAERRRDVRRTPYREAADPARRVVRADFMKKERKASSFLVPLIAVNRVLGFLVANQIQEAADGLLAQEERLRLIAAQLASQLRREQLQRRRGRSRLEALRAVATTDRLGLRLSDVSARALSLAEKKNLLFTTLNAIHDGVIVCDMFGQLVLYNERIAEIFEDAGLALHGRNMVDLVRELSGREREDIVTRFSRVLDGDVLELIVAPKGEGGPQFRFTLSAIRTRRDALHGLVALMSDITSLKELDRMKSNLLNLVSFRVLNILTSIQSYAELLTEAEGLLEDERDFARTIHEEAMSLGQVFDQFQAMASLELDDEGLRILPIDLAAIARDAFQSVEREQGKEVRLALDVPERIEVVAADQRLLEEAMLLAIGFAVENAERQSELVVTIAEEERYIRIDIRNEGFGMPSETAADLFAPPSEGHAAGPLRRVKEVFELHGGTAKSDAAIGEGLSFHLWLPLFMKGPAPAPVIRREEAPVRY